MLLIMHFGQYDFFSIPYWIMVFMISIFVMLLMTHMIVEISNDNYLLLLSFFISWLWWNVNNVNNVSDQIFDACIWWYIWHENGKLILLIWDQGVGLISQSYDWLMIMMTSSYILKKGSYGWLFELHIGQMVRLMWQLFSCEDNGLGRMMLLQVCYRNKYPRALG